ncbi:MAG: peptide ABC transporter substrate-binding protein [Clostridiaceae bacterium]|nr:peptide ABC transporter substrate-binding protein [Clostridiaceae bacterium]
MKKWTALLLAMLMVVTMLAGCTKAPATDDGSDGTSTETPSDNTGTSSDSETHNAEQVVKLMYSDEIADWNPMHPSSGTTWANWIDTLVEYDNYGMCQPCLAESWTKSEDGLTWTFKIREGVKWQNYDGSDYGTEVVAEDWVTTAKWILDPQNTARTADLLFDIVGAEDYYNAMSAEETRASANWDNVGIKAISTYELQFTLTAPCPYFLSRLTYNWGYPTCGQYLEEMGESFGTDNTTILYCGAFLCTQWESNSYYIDEANPEYWDKENIHIERIENKFNAEASTLAPEALLRGEVTYADIPTTQLDEWMNDPAKAALIRPNRPGSYSYFYLINFMPTYEEKTVDGYTLNHEQWLAAANNLNFRKSLYYGLDRIKAISCYDPYNPSNFEIRSITPPNFCAADGKDYTELDALTPFTSEEQFQSDKALEYKQKAVEELTAAGVQLPIVAYMPYQTDSQQVDMAVVVSQQLEALLGSDFIHFVLEGYPPTDYLATTRRAGNYSFMMSYWGPDYADPQTWTDPFALGQAYNYIWRADGMATQTTEAAGDGRMGRSGYDETYWKDSVYDEKVAAATQENVDLSKRYNALAEVEAWLLDQAFVIPLATLGGCGYLSSYMNPFESQYAPFGVSGDRYKYQYVMDKPMDTEEYLKQLAVWEQERAQRISEAQAAGIDY